MKHEPEVIALLRRFVNLVGPVWAARATAVILIMFVASLIMAILHPAGGEALLYNICICSGILSAGLVGTLAAVGVGVGVNLGTVLIAAGVNEAKNMNAQKALPSGIPQYDIYPDDICVEVPYGDRAEFEAEVARKHAAQRKNTYLFVFQFRRPDITVSDGSTTGGFKPRNSPEFCGWEIDYSFTEETPEQYYNYIERILTPLRNYLESERIKVTKTNVVSAIYEKAVAVVIALLLCSVSVFSQSNSDKIRDAVAGNDFAPKSGQQVHYTFSDGSSATRTADGNTKISDLFSARFGADNLQRGEVVGIDIDRLPLDIKVKITSSGTAQKPAPLFQTRMEAPHNEAVPPGKSFAESIPDSATVASDVNAIIGEADDIKAKIWKSIRPTWVLVMWVFDSIIFLIMGIGGIFWYYATTARKNGNLGRRILLVQRWASGRVLWICWITTTVLLIDIFLRLILWNVPIWGIMIIWAIIIWGATAVTNWLTPNGEELPFEEGLARYDTRALPNGNRR